MKLFDKFFQFDNLTEEVCGLTLELQGVYIYKLFDKEKKSIIYLTPTLYEANKMYQTLLNYTSEVLLFPMDNFLTSVALASSPELQSTRLATLNQLLDSNPKIIVTNLMGYLRFLPSKETYASKRILVQKGKMIDFNQFCLMLSNIGYKREDFVNKSGEYAKRGFVVDIYPLDYEKPFRIEFWGDEVDSIKEFDIDSQRTLDSKDEITISPFTDILIEENDNSSVCLDSSSIIDYVDDAILACSHYSEIMTLYEQILSEIYEYNKSLGIEKKYMHDFYLPTDKKVLYLENDDTKINRVKSTQNYLSLDLQPFSKNEQILVKEIRNYIKSKKTVIICLKSRYQLQKVEELFLENEVIYTTLEDVFENKINLVKFHLESGYIFQNYVVVSEKELFHQESSPVKYKSNFQMGTKIKDINKLHPGDYIVHVVHGIGQYKGLKTLIKNNVKKDYLTVEYKGGDKLYIPVEKIDLISKYSSNESIVPKINKLGGTEWEKTKLRVKKKLENIAGELLKLYAAREASRGIAFLPDDENQTIFESEFPYDETKDQLRVMDEIKHDMESIQPMDRLVCGDVGYGKTELAFRAMFKAVLSGYQVAYLCPTTILSDQHYKNAIARFQSFPVRIKILNRFVTPKEVKNTLEGLQNGTVDIVIGTHRLLSDDVVFKNLGLLIVDEEQRFGVKHKEKIKQLKKNIDILTLSATPIPRTLQMSMTGIRNLSLLETPPVDRFPIQTYVLQENNAIIKDALYKELARNGQSFILYNSVENMETKKLELERLVPDARIVSAHGQMSKTELETIMKKFVDHEYDILLCTTIIETGIDIPNVNTLLIMDADRFGLSQLYQIRGRVGRSNKIAYCYLMYTPGKVLSDIANKRLQVIKEFTELGSGFSIAMRDLSIRGAGDILGSEQAGYIDSVGIELYLKMLNEEVDKLKGVSIKEEMVDEQPLIDVATSISDDYVDSTDIKIYIHQEINSIDSFEKLQQVKEEIEDRFGKITDEMLIYMYEEWFEKLAHALGITQIRQTNNFIEVLLPTDLEENLDGEKLFLDILSISRMFRFGHRGKNTLIILDTVKLDKHFIYYLIDLMNAIMKAKKN